MSPRLLVASLLLVTPSLAMADDRAGTKGTVTAWDPAGANVIEMRICSRDKLTWDYVGCGARLRERVKEQLCATQGPGTHRFLYQVGDSQKRPSTVSCKK